MGHEASGTVQTVGSAVTDLKQGDIVAIEPGYPCRRCKTCKDGRYNLCRKMKFAADPPENHGMLAKYVCVPSDFCYKVPSSIGMDEAVLVEPLAVAVHANRLADIKPGQSVAVMGSGTVGLLCAAVAKAFGAAKIVIVDILDKKLDFAKAFLECHTFKPDTKVPAVDNAAKIMAEIDVDEGVDAVLEASGAESSIQTGIHVLRGGGSYVQTGLGRPEIIFPILALSEKELRVMGCFRYSSGDFALALSLLSNGQISIKSFISSVTPFEKAPEAWERTKKGEGIKNLIAGVVD